MLDTTKYRTYRQRLAILKRILVLIYIGAKILLIFVKLFLILG